MRKTKLFGAAAIFATAIVSSTATYAVLTFHTNKSLSERSQEFVSGYVSGAADLYAAFEDANYIKPEHSNDVKRAVKCSTNVGIITDGWRDYYRAGRVKDGDNAAASIYLALRDKC